MISKRIIYTDAEGGVTVLVPALAEQRPGEPEDAFVARIAVKDVPPGVPFEIVETATIPAERTFRPAWVRAGRAIEHDLPRCRLIAHDMRRAARAKEFAPLDIEATIPAKVAEAEAKRQAIRDRYDAAQAQIESADDVAALLAIVQRFPRGAA